MSSNPAYAVAILAFAWSTSLSAEPLPRPGLYEISFSLELPHLERYAIARTRTVCIGARKSSGAPPFPILSGNGAFSGCPARHIKRRDGAVSYDIACPGRATARATARYRIAPDRFRGRVAMVLGAKNMSMTEVQSGRRLQSCDLVNSKSG